MTFSATLHSSLIAAAQSVETPNRDSHNLCCERFESAEAVLRMFVDSDIIFGAGWTGALVQEQDWSSDECLAVNTYITVGLTAISNVRDGVVGPDVAAPYVSKSLRGIAWKIDTGVSG